jgi:hypothetical protein
MIISAANHRQYKAVLTSLVSYLHEKKYKKNHKFTDEELCDITHEQVLRFFCFHCFGDANPVFDETLKLAYRNNTCQYWKKALSHFLSDQQTKLGEMNKLMNMLGQMEVRKMGKDSQARDAIE